MPPSVKASLGETVYESVKCRLLLMASEIDEPIRIKEDELAKELGVSRTPVREALLRLGHEGILDFRPQRGAVLLPATREEYLEWLKLRAALEGFAAKEAALNASQHDVDNLRAILAPFNESNVHALSPAYAAANVEFHAAIIRLAANSLLEKVWHLFGHREMVESRTIEKLNRARESLREHHTLINAIESRNSELASRLASEHVHHLYLQIKQQHG